MSTQRVPVDIQCDPDLSCRICHGQADIAFVLCPEHQHLSLAADALLAALRELVDDLWNRLEAADQGCLVDDPPDWHQWLFSVMSTHGNIADAAVAKAEPS